MAASGSRDSIVEVEGINLCSRDWRVEEGGSLTSRDPEMEENQLTTDLWERLPEILVELILVKLPFSSLFRCCCVCRRWRTFILSDYALLYCDAGQLKIRQSNSGEWEKVSLRFLRVGECASLKLLASAGGLLCFTTDVVGEFVIYNPLTTCYKRLQMQGAGWPRSNHEFEPFMPFFWRRLRDSGGLVSWVVQVGMVANADTRGFKLIIAGIFQEPRRMTLVYDSLLDSWKQVASVPAGVMCFLTRAVTWRGNLYFIVFDNTCKLLKFRAETETWSLVLLPEQWKLWDTLIEYNSSLLLIQMTNKHLQAGRFAYFELQDSTEESPSWLPIKSLPLAKVLDSVRLRFPTVSKFPRFSSAHSNNITCLGQGDVIYFVGKIDSLGASVCDCKPVLRIWMHDFSTNTDDVTDFESEDFDYMCQVFKASMHPCN